MTRFVPEGEPGIPLSRIRYSNLTQDLKDRIGPDITEQELLDKINLALDRIILHFEEITGEKFTIEDVMEWL